MQTLVVMPTYDEALNIVEALTRVRAAVPGADVLVVDDNSPDGTAALARAAGAELGQVDVLDRPLKDGLGNAYRDGFKLGLERGYDRLVQMDADLSHDPAALPSLLAELDAGAVAVIGSRYVPGGSIPHWPWHRRALSKWGNRYIAAVLGIPVRDATAGYRAYNAATLRDIDIFSTRARGYGFQVETTYRVVRTGRQVVEVPISFTDRARGVSKMSLAMSIVEELGMVTWWGIRDRLRRLFRRR